MKLDPKTRAFGRVHEHYARIDSTNDRARAWLREGGPHGGLVTADQQSAGRGRQGRSWISPAAGDIYASLLSRPGVLKVELAPISLVVGLGLVRGLERVAPELRLGLKWPNDVVVRGEPDRKLAGILCETRWVGEVPEIVIGFGINVARSSFPPDLVATSLAAQGLRIEREAALESVLLELEDELELFFDDGFSALRDDYVQRCVTLGRYLERHGGTAVAVEADGGLRVETSPGHQTVLRSGEA